MNRDSLLAFGLAALAIAADVVVTITGHDAPGWFETLALVAVGGGAGVARAGVARATGKAAP